MRAKLIFGAGLLATAAFIVFITVTMNRYLRRPSPDGWRKVDALVAPLKRDGDGAAFFPAWLDGYARDKRRFDGLESMAAGELLAPGAPTHARVWVFSCFGALRVGKLTAAGWRRESEWLVGDVYVGLWVRPEMQISFRLVDRLNEIAVAPPGSVKVAWGKFRQLLKRGVAVPLQHGQNVVMSMEGLPAGRLLLCGGFVDHAFHGLNFQPVEAWVFAARAVRAHVRFPAHTGWRCESAGSVGASPQIVLSSASPGERPFLFDALVL